MPDAERRALQRLTRRRERLEDEVAAIKRRLLHLVRWACPAVEAVLPDFRTSLPLAVLHDLLGPARIAGMRQAALLRFVAARASGNHPHGGPFAENLVGGLKAAAAETQRLHGAAVDLPRLQPEVAPEVDRVNAALILPRSAEVNFLGRPGMVSWRSARRAWPWVAGLAGGAASA
ncbi:hypothetical protein [Craurococcus roseus]|uniref:hypothetical protein n=1 Tax=Craurococcus roseus TaxID=77585 RepID=UPI0031D967E2